MVLNQNKQIFRLCFFFIKEIHCTCTVYIRLAFKSVNVVFFLPCLFNLFAPLYSITCIDYNATRYL